jgi:hypothetical protein
MSRDPDATALIREHGGDAPQLLVEQLVRAVKAEDEERIVLLDRQLRAVDALLQNDSDVTAGISAPPASAAG